MAYEFYISIEGQKQGRFKGETGRAAPSEEGTDDDRGLGRNKIAGVRFVSEASSPRDVATGHASGKRTHKPILITKEWGAASPQLFQALVTNENLKSVLFEFVKTNAKGEEEIYHTITLTNAAVSNIKSYLDLTDTSGDAYDAHELEDVSFVFQKIEMENREGKTQAVDSWQV
jgi:type VI secretion system secreted protein Hcp